MQASVSYRTTLFISMLYATSTAYPSTVSVSAEVAVAELVDKITILEIKCEKIDDPKKLYNIKHELEILQQTYANNVTHTPELETLKQELRERNRQLWDLEDATREKEGKKEFDQEFAQLTRSIYLTNDERGIIKREINAVAGSAIVEEKSYTEYRTQPTKYSWSKKPTPTTTPPTKILVEMAVGELIDKITVLEIKFNAIPEPIKRKNICAELAALYATLCSQVILTQELKDIIDELRTTNKRMWDNEDARREKERRQEFDEEFIQLGRNVYYINDHRVALKRKINILFGSHIMEEKKYTNYKIDTLATI